MNLVSINLFRDPSQERESCRSKQLFSHESIYRPSNQNNIFHLEKSESGSRRNVEVNLRKSIPRQIERVTQIIKKTQTSLI